VDVVTGNWSAAKADAAKFAQDIANGFKHNFQAMTGDGAAAALAAGPGGAPADKQAQAAAAAGGAGVAGWVGGGTSSSVQDRIASYLKSKGLTADKVQGVLAGIFAETRFRTNAFNGSGGGQGAFGIGQWRGPRLAALRARYGNNPTLDQQLEFLWSELTGGDSGGAGVLGANGAGATARAYLQGFMRPGSGLSGDISRASRFLGVSPASLAANGGSGGVTLMQKTDIHVGGGGDAITTAKAVADQQRRVNGDLVRRMKVAAS
jgi:hypothetical protein